MDSYPSMDHKLLDQLKATVEGNLQNEQFGVAQLSEASGLSKSQLNRRLKALTGQSASQFVREYRLRKAMELLKSQAATPTEVAYQVGFGSPSYFSTCFKEFYGYSPGEVLSEKPETSKTGGKSPAKAVWMIPLLLILIGTSYVFYLQFNGDANDNRNEDASNSKVESAEIDRSIAVLPFRNLSNNDEDLYLTDGMMNAIYQHLSRMGDLILRPATSTASYRNSLKKVEEISKELEVAYILEGSFQKVGERATVLVSLIDAKMDKVIWLGDYNEVWSDIFSVQNKVATNVANELQVVLNEDTKKALQLIPTTNMEAYDLYLRALNLYKESNDHYSFEEVEEPLLEAIQLDPGFSLPYIMLGLHYRNKSEGLFGKDRAGIIREAKRNLKKAIKLDPYNGWAYGVLGGLNFQKERDLAAANRNFEKALKLSPNDWYSVRGYYYHKYFLGNCEKMQSLMKQMQEIEPGRGKSPISIYKILQLECEDRYQEIMELGDRYFQQIVARSHWTWKYFFQAYVLKQEFDKAQKLLDDMAVKGLGEDDVNMLEAILQAKQGHPELAKALIQEISRNINPTLYIDLASLYEALGDEENMYAQLELLLVHYRETEIFALSTRFFEHQEDPRFQDIIARSWVPIKY